MEEGTKAGGTKDEPLLKVSVTQNPVLLKPKLAVSARQEKDNLIFDITCNYYLFITRSKLNLYNQNHKLLKTIDLPHPLPTTYTIPLSELKTQEPMNLRAIYYQLSVYDQKGAEDRTGVGNVEIKQEK